MSKECGCENVKPNDNETWQCMICRKKFVPLDIVPRLFEEGMADMNAQSSIVGNLLVVVMPVPKQMEQDDDKRD